MFATILFVIGVLGIIAAEESSGCGSPKNQSGEEGSFSSMNYPNLYDGIADCRWLITVPKSKKIKITFNRIFELERSYYNYDCYDYIEVVTISKKIGKYCGTIAPAPILIEANKASISFKSDSSTEKKGFNIQWSAVESADSESSECGVLRYANDKRRSFSSMNYPNEYEALADCSWWIQLPFAKKIKLTFSEIFELEKIGDNCMDYVEVSTLKKKIGQYCGQIAPPPILIEGSVALVKFKSNSNVNKKGFRIQWSEVDAADEQDKKDEQQSGCNSPKILLGNGGAFSSMNYPNLYQNSANCNWLIRVSFFNRIKLTFDSNFELEKGMESGRCYDFVKVYEGSNSNGKEIGFYCGEEAPDPILVRNNEAFVVFQSDNAIPLKGFRIEWTEINF